MFQGADIELSVIDPLVWSAQRGFFFFLGWGRNRGDMRNEIERVIGGCLGGVGG